MRILVEFFPFMKDVFEVWYRHKWNDSIPDMRVVQSVNFEARAKILSFTLPLLEFLFAPENNVETGLYEESSRWISSNPTNPEKSNSVCVTQ